MNYNDILFAFHFVGSAQPCMNRAFISRKTGEVYYVSGLTGLDERPEDIDDMTTYLSIPHKNEMDLGTKLVLAFAKELVPEHYEQISDIFSRRGAYARYKDFLEEHGILKVWHKYEERKWDEAIRKWCSDNDITVSEPEK